MDRSPPVLMETYIQFDTVKCRWPSLYFPNCIISIPRHCLNFILVVSDNEEKLHSGYTLSSLPIEVMW